MKNKKKSLLSTILIAVIIVITLIVIAITFINKSIYESSEVKAEIDKAIQDYSLDIPDKKLDKIHKAIRKELNKNIKLYIDSNASAYISKEDNGYSINYSTSYSGYSNNYISVFIDNEYNIINNKSTFNDITLLPNKNKNKFIEAFKEYDSSLSNNDINKIYKSITNSERYKNFVTDTWKDYPINIYINYSDSDKKYYDTWKVTAVMLEIDHESSGTFGYTNLFYLDNEYNLLEHKYVIEDASITDEDEQNVLEERYLTFKNAMQNNEYEFGLSDKEIQDLWNEIINTEEYEQAKVKGRSFEVDMWLYDDGTLRISLQFRYGRYFTVMYTPDFKISEISIITDYDTMFPYMEKYQ